VPGVRPVSLYVALVCHALLVAPGLPEVSVKRYWTGPLESVPVVAIMAIDVVPVAFGAVEKVAGLGVGGAVSPPAADGVRKPLISVTVTPLTCDTVDDLIPGNVGILAKPVPFISVSLLKPSPSESCDPMANIAVAVVPLAAISSP